MAQRPSPRSERNVRPAADRVHPVVHFLDMGEDRYGDCIIVTAGQCSVMIDGAHPRDLQGQANTASIPEQLAQIFGHEPPFDLTLVVVTHGHNDHIGCLPELIEQGIIRPRFALVSDPSHCFPPGARDLIRPDDGLDDRAQNIIQRVVTGLAEEDHSDLPESEVRLFLDRTLKLGVRYRIMVERLDNDPDVHLVRWSYARRSAHADL